MREWSREHDEEQARERTHRLAWPKVRILNAAIITIDQAKEEAFLSVGGLLRLL